MTDTLLYQLRAKSSTGNYEVGTFRVGDRVHVSVNARLPKSKIYLLCQKGTITQLGKKAIVLIDATQHKESHEVELDLGVLEKCPSLPNLTYVAGWEPVSHLPESLPEDLNLLDSLKQTNTVATSSVYDFPESPTTKTCDRLSNSILSEDRDTTSAWKDELASSHVRHPANPSPLKESGKEVQINETASQMSSAASDLSNPSSPPSKTYLDCYQPPLIPETNQAHIFGRSSGNFTSVGTMQNGLLSEQPSLGHPGKANDYCSLPRPGALSKSSPGSRPPGNTKSEAQAKKLGLIRKNEVYNPQWLELQFGLPLGWTSPQECRAATQLLALVEPPSEIASTPELLLQPLGEYSTSTRSVAKKSDCWYTPPHIVDKVIQVLGEIDLDPCADDGKHIRAKLHYTATDDGLNREWHGRVFMNPPYSCPGVWMAKLQAEVESGRVTEALALVPNATDTKWLSPVLKTQVVCFWTGRIKFLDTSYQPRLSARQAHCLVYWGDNWQRFQQVFDEYGVVQLPPALTSKELLGDKENSPSNLTSPSKKRLSGEGNGYIHWRTITKNGKDYPQAYYHWKENGKKRTKYIPQHLLGVIQQAEQEKHPVIEILELLGVGASSQELLGDKQANDTESIEITFVESSPSNDISPSKTRRDKGDGSGSIHWRTITKNGKDYPQAYYHYEFWSGGDRLIKSTKYIPKKLLAQIQELEAQKAPVREILQVLGVMV